MYIYTYNQEQKQTCTCTHNQAQNVTYTALLAQVEIHQETSCQSNIVKAEIATKKNFQEKEISSNAAAHEKHGAS